MVAWGGGRGRWPGGGASAWSCLAAGPLRGPSEVPPRYGGFQRAWRTDPAWDFPESRLRRRRLGFRWPSLCGPACRVPGRTPSQRAPRQGAWLFPLNCCSSNREVAALDPAPRSPCLLSPPHALVWVYRENKVGPGACAALCACRACRGWGRVRVPEAGPRTAGVRGEAAPATTCCGSCSPGGWGLSGKQLTASREQAFENK